MYMRLMHWLLALVTASVFFTLTLPVKREHYTFVKPEEPGKISAPDSLEVDSLSSVLPAVTERATSPQPVSPAVIFHGSRDRKVVALTIDACSTTRPRRCGESLPGYASADSRSKPSLIR
jgi:hypothetical protein